MKPARIVFPLAVLTVALVIASPGAFAQTSVEDALKQLSSENSKGYMQPIADLFGANMNAGFYHTAAIPKVGFNLAFDVVVMGAIVGDDQKSYTAKAPPGFNPGTANSATIFGGQGALIRDQGTGLSYRLPDGVLNTSMFPLIVPQLTIGSIAGSEVVIRYIFVPKLGSETVPSTSLWGAGVRHNVSQWFLALPVDIAASFFYNKFTSGDLIDFTGYSLGAQVSKSLSLITIYGGLGWEKSTLTLKYTSSDPTAGGSVNVDFDGANTFRFTGGAMLSLGIFRVFADINVGSITHFSGGIGFGG